MWRYFLILFVLSAGATVGALYWSHHYPERMETKSVVVKPKPEDTAKIGAGKTRSFEPMVRQIQVPISSATQNLVTLVSIVSSVLSALGTMISAYIAWAGLRASRAGAGGADRA